MFPPAGERAARVARPHLPWSGEEHSEALLARVRRLLTLEQVHAETVALGMPLSVSQISRMERGDGGSDEAWRTLARVLGEPVERLRPARGNLLEPQAVLPGTSS